MQPESQTSPPVLAAPPPLAASEPRSLAILLSVCLGLFLLDAVFSILDDSLGLLLGLHFLSVIRSLFGLFALLISLPVYVLMAFVPAIPKRYFIPVTLFTFAALLVSIPLLIFFFQRQQLIMWCISLGQLAIGLGILCHFQGGLKFRWPLVPANRLPIRNFRWRNCAAFVVGSLVALPLVTGVYLFACSSLAVSRLSDGFMALRPGGISVQVRTYRRADGKEICLFPMAHVADAAFYQRVAQSFPTNSIILMEGVTDDHNLITNKISYKRMASSLGLAEQHEQFKPTQGEVVPADVDVSIFSKDTIDLLNLAMFIHTHGVNAGNIQVIFQFNPTPNLEYELIDDLVHKRNAHLIEQVQLYLPKSDELMIPWGAAHMPDLARQIQKSGFRLAKSQDYQVIRFHF